jgi:DNA-binding transcriptional LysR family regulator
MNIRKLEHFISIANHLNFTKAAEECFIAETAISQSIASMEQELDFKLFYRTNRKVELTPAGKRFYADLPSILDQYYNAVNSARNISSDHENLLKIGFVSSFESLPMVNILEDFLLINQNIQVTVSQCGYKMLTESLKNSDLDMACIQMPYDIQHLANFNKRLIASETYCVALCKSHPLAIYDSLDVNMFADETIIATIPPWEQVNNHEWTKKLCRDFHLNIDKIKLCTGSIDAALIMAELNMGLFFITTEMKNSRYPNLVYKELQNSPICETYILFKEQNKKNSVKIFSEYIESYIKT